MCSWTNHQQPDYSVPLGQLRQQSLLNAPSLTSPLPHCGKRLLPHRGKWLNTQQMGLLRVAGSANLVPPGYVAFVPLFIVIASSSSGFFLSLKEV